MREAEVQVEGYAHVHGTSMRAKKLPVLYTPYLLWPVKRERSSGFLVPNIGYSQRKGAELGLAYFQTLGRSYDTTFHLDTYTQGFLGFGNEFRYAPTAGTKGNLIGYSVYDPTTRSWRWKLVLDHTTNDLPNGMRAVVQYQDYSDFNFFRDFERDFDTTPCGSSRAAPSSPATGDRTWSTCCWRTARRSSTCRTTRSSSAGSPAPVPPALDPDRQDPASTWSWPARRRTSTSRAPTPTRGSTGASTSSRRSPCR